MKRNEMKKNERKAKKMKYLPGTEKTLNKNETKGKGTKEKKEK